MVFSGIIPYTDSKKGDAIYGYIEFGGEPDPLAPGERSHPGRSG